MQENNVDQPPSLSQLLRESYLAEARAQQRHSEMSRSDSSSSRRLVYGPLKGKAEDPVGHDDPQLPDLSAFLSQEELDKSVNLARQAIGHEPREERAEVKAPAALSATPSDIPSASHSVASSSMTPTASVTAVPPAEPFDPSFASPAVTPFAPTFAPPSATSSAQPAPEIKALPPTHTPTLTAADRKMHQASVQDNVMRNNKASSEAANDFNRSARNTPYGPENQSKKEFLNKAADFIEELSSLFKANSSKRVRPRVCKAHRSRSQNKVQNDGTVYAQSPDDRERPIMPLELEAERSSPAVSYQPEVQPDSGIGPHEFPVQDCRITGEQYSSASEEVEEATSAALTETPYSADPVCEPPGFIQKLKSREVPEGSKVQLDCIVRGLPVPEVRWFCEGKELENCPDIQIITDGELHSLIIAEAFEEDTGRYSCFASNFYGTDSTSAEIYIEGASSSDSEVEQHLEHAAQPQGKPATPAQSSPPATSPTVSVGVEDSSPHSTAVAKELPQELPSQPVSQVATAPPLPVQILTTAPPLPVQISATAPPQPVQISTTGPPQPVQISTTGPPLPVQISTTAPPLPVQISNAATSLPVQISTTATSLPVQTSTTSPPLPVQISTTAPSLPVQISTTAPPLPAQISTTAPPLPVQISTTVVLAPELSKAPGVSTLQPAQEETTISPIQVAPTLPPEETEPPAAQEVSTPVLVTSIPQPVQTAASLPLSTAVSSAPVAPTQTAIPESQNYDSYPQGLDGRPIMAAPVFTKSLQDLLASEGQLVVLECRVKGVPSPRVEWYREGSVIEDSPDFRLLQKKPRSTAESEEICTLVIAEVFPEDSGMFTCTASNKYGTVSSIAALRVKGSGNNSNHAKSLSSFIKESSRSQEPSPADFTAPTPKPQPEAPVTNSIKPHSSTIRLDPLSSSTLRLDPLSTSTLRLDPLSSSMLRPDPLSTSLPSLDALSLSSSPRLGTRSTSTPLLDPLYLSTHHQDMPGSSGAHTEPQSSGKLPSYLIPFSGSLSVAEPQSSGLKTNQEVSRPTLPDLATSGTPKAKGTPNHQNGSPTVVPLPDPPTNSCLKTPGNSVNHKEPRSSARVGLRVHFKLPEFEEDEESDASSQSYEDAAQANKGPPPVLAKPKLDPAQLQLLHNQVLMEQQQDSEPPQSHRQRQPQPHPQPQHQPQPPPQQQPQPQPHPQPHPQPQHQPQHQPQPPPQQQPQPQPQLQPQPPPQQQPQPQLQPQPQPQPPPQQQLQPQRHPTPQQQPQPQPQPQQPQPQSHPEPAVWSPKMHHDPRPQPPQPHPTTPIPQQTPYTEPPRFTAPPLPSLNSTSVPLLSTTSPPQFNTTPAPPMRTLPSTPQLKTAPVITCPPPVPQLNTAPAPLYSIAPVTQMNTIHASHLNLSPASLSRTQPSSHFSFPPAPHLSMAPAESLGSFPASLSKAPSLQQITSPTPLLRSTHASLMNLAPNSQSFNYARPKEFITAQTLSPVRSLSPTESPVPLLHELAAELNSSAASSPTIPPFSPPPRVFPTRVLTSPTSPQGFIASPTLQAAPFLNSVFSMRTQSPPQASSPTSSSSTPSPIQNPVAFLSSVLPSMPTVQPTNAMGLPRRAPLVGPHGILKKTPRSRLLSDGDIRDNKETLLHDMEKKLRFREESTRFEHQQKPPYEEKTASRPLGPNIPATVVNYDEEYRLSNFEQRLMSEIEFRLERTPVEESDDEIHHDEIPTGKCIAPIFDRKLRNFRAVEGVPVTFSCKLVGIPIPKVYWFKDGKQILRKNDHYKKIREGDGTCALHIEATTNDDDGNYTVMAANPQGRISCSGHLIVQTGPIRNRMTPIHSQRVRARVQEVEEGEQTQERFFRPHFLQAPGDMVAHEGRLCRLDCKVSGLPNPELMWLVNGRPIYPDLLHKMLVRENGVHSLVIDPLMQNDGGTYTCIASNKAGQSSFCLELKVVEKEMKQPPQFVEKLQNTGIPEGTPVRLDCRVLGMPPPVIFWKKDNDSIPHNKDRFSMHLDATGYVCLIIQPSKKEDAGWYTVSAKNEAGIVSCTARLDIYAQWHQSIPSPMKKPPRTGSRYAALTGQGLDIKSAFPSSENSPILFSSSPREVMLESDEL